VSGWAVCVEAAKDRDISRYFLLREILFNYFTENRKTKQQRMSGDYGGFGGGMSEEEQIALALQLSQETSSHQFPTQTAPKSNVNTSKNTRIRELPFNASNYAAKLREGFGNLFKQPIGSDVTLELKHKSGVEKIHCHSLVLSVWR
jgi:hypothetical protein